MIRALLAQYWANDRRRWFALKQRCFWQPYERLEWTRLEAIRAKMSEHRSFPKNEVLEEFEQAE